jgi:hypothetical protein
MPRLVITEKELQDVEIIDVSAKTVMWGLYDERCCFLIYQESPYISGILRMPSSPPKQRSECIVS